MLSPVEEIKNRLDVVDVIQGYIKLTKAGVNYKALCPFHKEKTPSFVVSPERQIWRCFGCGKGGDIFSFVMEMEGLEFRDALRVLAKKAGVVLKKEDPKLRSEKTRLFEVNELATQFFEKNLKDKRAKEIKTYLKKRGVLDKTIKEFRLGYAFESWRELKDHLTSLGLNEKDMISSGLEIKPQEDQKAKSSYDRFRSRIMFPIFDLTEQVVGFSGRIYPEPGDGKKLSAKYINSPNTLIYNKSRTLYGLSKARQSIRKNKFAILVEGNLDVILSHQAGVKNVLATCGTALNQDHLKILKRYTDKLKLCFDQDEAGKLATKDAIKKALALGFNLKVIVFKKSKDPADLILDNPKTWKQAVRGGDEFIEYCFKKSFEAHSEKTPQAKKEIAKELLPFIKSLENTIEQSHWMNQLAEKLEIDEKYLYEALAKTKTNIQKPKEEEKISEASPKNPDQGLEELILIILLKYPELAENFDKKVSLKTPEYQKLFEKLLKKKKPAKSKILEYLLLKTDVYEFDDKDAKEELDSALIKLKKKNIQKDLKEKIHQLKQAEQDKKLKQIESLLKEIQVITETLKQLN